MNGTEVSRGGTVLREIARNIERIESGNAHDRVDESDATVELLQVLRFVGGAEDVRVG